MLRDTKVDEEINIYKLESFESLKNNVKNSTKNLNNSNNDLNIKFPDNYSIYDTMTLNSVYTFELEKELLKYKKEEKASTKNNNKRFKQRKLDKQSNLFGISVFINYISNKINNLYEIIANKLLYDNSNDDIALYQEQDQDQERGDRSFLNLFNNNYKDINSKENKEIGKYISQMLNKNLQDDCFYTVDRIEKSQDEAGNIVVLENRQSLDMIDIEESKIGFSVTPGDILYYLNGEFEKCDNYSKTIKDTIEDKMNRLWED